MPCANLMLFLNPPPASTSLRAQLRVLNSYCSETLLALADILLPLPQVAAQMAGLDIAPMPGRAGKHT